MGELSDQGWGRRRRNAASRVWTVLAMMMLVVAIMSAGPGIGTAVAQESGGDETRLDRQTPTSVDDFRKLQTMIRETVAKVRPAVVGMRIGGSGGSGAFISADGWIITAAHVTGYVAERPVQIFLADGTSMRGVTKGWHRPRDFALVKADTDGREVPFVELGDSSEEGVTAGQWLIAMGHPLGTETDPFRPPVVRIGRLHQRLGGPSGFLRTDAPLISGDSGGPLFDLTGKQVGVNVSIDPRMHTANNCTPVNPAIETLDAMKQGKDVTAMTDGGSSGMPRSGGTEYDRLNTQAVEHLEDGKYAEAEKVLGKMIEMAPDLYLAYYNLACCYSLWSTEKEGGEAAAMRTKALEALEVAVDKGWTDYNHMADDSDLDAIRESDGYWRLEQMIKRELGHGALLGIRMMENESPLRISEVTAGTGAARAGIEVGDLIVGVDGIDNPTGAQLRAALGSREPLDTITLKLRRGDKTFDVEVTLGARDEPSRMQPGNVGPRLAPALWKNGANTRSALGDVAATVGAATITVKSQGKIVGYGVVIREDGVAMVKKSDLGEITNRLTVVLPDGREIDAVRRTSDSRIDIALLRLELNDGEKLAAVEIAADATTEIGDILVAVQPGGQALAIGTQSLTSYVTKGALEDARIGITLGNPLTRMERQMMNLPGGVRVGSVEEDSFARRAGMQRGDIIVEFDGTRIESNRDLLAAVRGKRVGDTVDVKVFRNNQFIEMRVTLMSARMFMPEGSSSPMGGRMGMIIGKRSNRFEGFGEVIQHDLPIMPEQCGSPLVSLDGKLVGINIGRSDRTKTYALSAATLAGALPKLLRSLELAERAGEDGDF
jgi:S1-C subfamily serine protease